MGFWDKEQESVESIQTRKGRKMERFMKMQVLPGACRFLMIAMLVLTPLTVLADVSAFFRYGSELGMEHMVRNMAITAVSVWSIPGLLLLGLSVFQLFRLKNGFQEKQGEPWTPADFGDNNRFDDAVFQSKSKRRTPEKKYLVYCIISSTGMLLLGLFCIFAFIC